MHLSVYIAFVFAVCIVLLIPGPSTLMVVGCALAEGRGAALPLVLGVALGDAVCVLLSMAGVGALFHASPLLFLIFKAVGAVFLMGLGVVIWRAAPRYTMPGDGRLVTSCMLPRNFWARLGQTFAMTALNPNAIVSLMAFLPQFLDHDLPLRPQLLLLGITFVSLGMIYAVAFVLLADRVRRAVSHPGLLVAMHRICGAVLVGAGLLTAGLRISG